MFNRKIIIGLIALVSSFAGAVAATSAAKYFPTTKQGALTKYEAKQTNIHVFTTNGGTVECVKDVFSGTTPPSTGSKAVQVVPSYGECTLAGEKAKVVNTNCAFEFLEPTGTNPKYIGNVNISAVPGQKLCSIVIIATLFGTPCEVKVENLAANKNLSQVKALDMASNTILAITTEISEITYSADTGAGCTMAGIKSGSKAKYAGEVETTAMYVA